MAQDEETPAETPYSRAAAHNPDAALQAVVENFETRINTLEREQYKHFDDYQGNPEKRAALTRSLVSNWVRSLITSLVDTESERPSQTQINVNIPAMPPPKVPSHSSFFGSARTRRRMMSVAIVVGGSIIGFVYAARALGLMH